MTKDLRSWTQMRLPGLGVTRALMKDRAARMAAVFARTRRRRHETPSSILASRRKAARKCGFCTERGYSSCASPGMCFTGT